MGKKDKKKDSAKKFALAAKKEAKADKKAQKRLLKQEKQKHGTATSSTTASYPTTNNDDDIDAILESYKRQNQELTTPSIEFLDKEFPYPPRGNFTLTLCPSTGNIIMFGGEYFDGIENVIFDELFSWNPDAKSKTDDDDDDDDNDPKEKIPKRGVWKRIIAPSPKPKPRCSHTTVYYNKALYIFGGELATSDNYHHYRDFWKFDLQSNLWTELKSSSGSAPPSPRSGHRAIVYKHYMIVFGGFFEAARVAPRWYNDLHVYDFSCQCWMDFSKTSKTSSSSLSNAMSISSLTMPAERSAFNFGVHGDIAYMYGGFCKLKHTSSTPTKAREGCVYSDCWILNCKPLNNGLVPTWERISSGRKNVSVNNPSLRSGTSCTMWKNKLLLYGGVQDDEKENHLMASVFYNDLFSFDTERRKWYPLGLLKKKTDKKKKKRKKKESLNTTNEEHHDDNEDDGSTDDDGDNELNSSGWDLDKVRSNMFAFIDGDGNIVYEKIEQDEEEQEEEMKKIAETKKSIIDDKSMQERKQKKNVEAKEESELMESNNDSKEPSPKQNTISSSRLDEQTKHDSSVSQTLIQTQQQRPIGVAKSAKEQTLPLPRINSQIVVRNNILYIYGGILEVGDREVTLDDCWSIDLIRRTEWICVWEGTMHKQVWKGVDSDDNESYVSTDRDYQPIDDDDDGVDTNCKEAFPEFFGFSDSGSDDNEEAIAAAKLARKLEKKALKKEKMRGIREEVKLLNEKLNLDNNDDGMRNSASTPLIGEELAAFYSRTAEYWETRVKQRMANNVETAQCDSGGKMSTKEYKREGFNLAKLRYDELKPILDRLNKLEGIEKEHKEQRKIKKERKKDKKRK